MTTAHFNSGFTENNSKPSSLLYVMDADNNTANWATYDNFLTDWTAQFITENKTKPIKDGNTTISSKYKSQFSFISNAPTKNILEPKIEKTLDTIMGNSRHLTICITPQRSINRVEVFKNDIELKEATINGVKLGDYSLLDSTRKLVLHYVKDNGYTEINLVTEVNVPVELTILEASNDLLTNENFSVPVRPKNEIPMPFVLNDAILITKTVKY